MDHAAFLGPKAENADELERLLLEVLHDHTFWRRNFHPEDPRLIAESDKRTEAFAQTAASIRDELFQILAELKRGAPLYSPRQIGHMVSDPTLPALVGYFAGMLYNQNNVVAEAAPETVRKEHAFMAALARMVGYPPMLPERLPAGARRQRTAFSWGHLASGGTGANLEALWVARNVRLYPLAVRLLARERAFAEFGEFAVAPAGRGEAVPLTALRTFELLNLPVRSITELHLRVRARLAEAGREAAVAFEAAFPSVRKAGLAGLMQRYNDAFPGDQMRAPVVFASRAAHYGWGKAMDVVGLGAAGLVTLPTDDNLRLDVGALEAAIREHASREVPTLMVIGICGTTEEGAVDPLHRIQALRNRLRDEGLVLWHHADAAFGGYLAAALPRDASGAAPPFDPDEPTGSGILGRDVYDAVAALAEVDSITIDPHKWGYIPYPAGAVLFRDFHVRDSIAFAAPYLPETEQTGFGGFLGRWTLEGSRPGAPAVSAYLSQAVLPLDPSGHGALVRDCIAASRALVDALERQFADGPVAFRPLAQPDSVGFCFALVPRGDVSIPELNALTRRLWRNLSVDGRSDVSAYQFILSKTEVPVAHYRGPVERMLGRALREDEAHETLMLLRSFILDPFVAAWNRLDDPFAERFARCLGEIAAAGYPEHALRAHLRRHGRRLDVLVVEQPGTEPLAERLQLAAPLAAYLDVRATSHAAEDLAAHLERARPQRVVVVGASGELWMLQEAALAQPPEALAETIAQVARGGNGQPAVLLQHDVPALAAALATPAGG
jgi:glutamate/tyrosine decarboxylase-like PLP-dependent enzyme